MSRDLSTSASGQSSPNQDQNRSPSLHPIHPLIDSIHIPVVLPPVMPFISFENCQSSGIVSNQSSSASSSASQTQSSSLSQMQDEPIGSSVNAQKARVLSPLELLVRPTSMESLLFPSSTTSFPAIFRDPVHL